MGEEEIILDKVVFTMVSASSRYCDGCENRFLKLTELTFESIENGSQDRKGSFCFCDNCLELIKGAI